MILAADLPRARARAREAAADAARRLRRDLPRDGRAAGDDPAARSAAARVPAARGREIREVAAALGSDAAAVRAQDRRAERVQPDARAPRLPARDHVPRDLRMQVRAIVEAACEVAEAGARVAARDHDPARRRTSRRARAAARARRGGSRGGAARSARARACRSAIGTMIEVPRAALTADADRRATPTSSRSAPTTSRR